MESRFKFKKKFQLTSFTTFSKFQNLKAAEFHPLISVKILFGGSVWRFGNFEVSIAFIRESRSGRKPKYSPKHEIINRAINFTIH